MNAFLLVACASLSAGPPTPALEFSTEIDFVSTGGGHAGDTITHGDLLPNDGTVVAPWLTLMNHFCPKPVFPNFGLDAVHEFIGGEIWFSIETDLFDEFLDAIAGPPGELFVGCGVLVQGVECVLFQADAGGRYVLDHIGAFVVGDRVRVVGGLDPDCATPCLQGDGCIEDNFIFDCRADLSGDGSVNGADLGILLGAWTG